MHIYIYIYSSLSLSIYIYIYIYISLSLHIYIYMHMCVHIRIYVFIHKPSAAPGLEDDLPLLPPPLHLDLDGFAVRLREISLLVSSRGISRNRSPRSRRLRGSPRAQDQPAEMSLLVVIL